MEGGRGEWRVGGYVRVAGGLARRCRCPPKPRWATLERWGLEIMTCLFRWGRRGLWRQAYRLSID